MIKALGKRMLCNSAEINNVNQLDFDPAKNRVRTLVVFLQIMD